MYLPSCRWFFQIAQWCCRGWHLPGPAAQAQLHYHSVHDCLRWVSLRQKVETVFKGTRQTASPLFSWCYSLLGKKSRGVLLFLNRSIQLQTSKRPTVSRKKVQDKGSEWFSPTAYHQKVGKVTFSLSCPCTWGRQSWIGNFQPTSQPGTSRWIWSLNIPVKVAEPVLYPTFEEGCWWAVVHYHGSSKTW